MMDGRKKRILEEASSSNPAQPVEKKRKTNDNGSESDHNGSESDNGSKSDNGSESNNGSQSDNGSGGSNSSSGYWSENEADDRSFELQLSELTMRALPGFFGDTRTLVYATMKDATISGELFCRCLLAQIFPTEMWNVKAGEEPGSVKILFVDNKKRITNESHAQLFHCKAWDWKGLQVLFQRVGRVKRFEVDPCNHFPANEVEDQNIALEPVKLNLSVLTMLHLEQRYDDKHDNMVYSLMPDSPVTPEFMCRCFLYHNYTNAEVQIVGGDINGSVIMKFDDHDLAQAVRNTTWRGGRYTFSFLSIASISTPEDLDEPSKYTIERIRSGKPTGKVK